MFGYLIHQDSRCFLMSIIWPIRVSLLGAVLLESTCQMSDLLIHLGFFLLKSLVHLNPPRFLLLGIQSLNLSRLLLLGIWLSNLPKLFYQIFLHTCTLDTYIRSYLLPNFKLLWHIKYKFDYVVFRTPTNYMITILLLLHGSCSKSGSEIKKRNYTPFNFTL